MKKKLQKSAGPGILPIWEQFEESKSNDPPASATMRENKGEGLFLIHKKSPHHES